MKTSLEKVEKWLNEDMSEKQAARLLASWIEESVLAGRESLKFKVLLYALLMVKMLNTGNGSHWIVCSYPGDEYWILEKA